MVVSADVTEHLKTLAGPETRGYTAVDLNEDGVRIFLHVYPSKDMEDDFSSNKPMMYTIVVLVVLALRLPFLNQAVQGDDYNYLAGAMHAQVDPLHPTHGKYVFLGRMVDMRGHPHPPLNMWA